MQCKKLMFAKGIDIGILDDINYPCHLILGHSDDDFPGTAHVYSHLLDLPAYETLSQRKLARIADALSEIE